MLYKWHWESTQKKIAVELKQEVAVKAVPPTSTKIAPREVTPRRRENIFHPRIPLKEQSGSFMGPTKQLYESLYWFIYLMDTGGFISGDIDSIKRRINVQIMDTIIKRQEEVKLYDGTIQGNIYNECIHMLMHDTRIPLHNEMFPRILVTASKYNAIIVSSDGSKEIIAPWKQRRKCILIKQMGDFNVFEIVEDTECKEMYSLKDYMPKTKTAKSKISKYELYLICQMFEIHSPKYTKKSMLEQIDVKLID